MNSKFIKIILIILTLFVIIFGILYTIRLRNAEPSTPETDGKSSLTSTGRTIFNTAIGNNSESKEFPQNSEISSSSTKNVDTEDFKDGQEDIIHKKIEKLLFDWETTKDKNLLIEAINLSANADNEVILSAWTDFMKKNSAELVKVITGSSNEKQTREDIRRIFEWYVELSGEYEKLSSTKRQEISRQYQQLK